MKTRVTDERIAELCDEDIESWSVNVFGMKRLVLDLRDARAEVARLRDIIKTGGASYRAERSVMGIPGGIDPDQEPR